ncbi:UDP-N-acetylmuramoylalanyl-D-glutamyl-2,6-diaminopimelate--D-alanyl-D-alanine ligase [Desulfovibrio sp. DV]|uniref:UDP-N-acetylmuramoyl-tripeptide--D-alanyl-D- alanine ligase n=1 Tax=Desulfovibrio sp. DV TaxID=1844708 RepID=UPI00094B9CBD|nr:UDP-N-acetylmuramoyl-tripeptide--D-alanyl-D-alanine ligase [Desulfovibrio sp. DV]OLN25836.1 UDP-N-acetylmuramoylalanyl-D-glutamyl-2,6-diaminopimelate--D-alanyl-D-alanine ligase [Desulfovibrio sp. DV]
MRMTLSDLLVATGAVGDVGERGNPVIESVRIDSRAAAPASLFVCIPGERLDGHNFAAEAVAKGAAAVLADRPLSGLPEGTPVLLVRDTVAALGKLARAWRERVGARLVAVSGSAGKTTVKELTASILSKVGPTAKNYKNFNNKIGLPLSMLEAGEADMAWVMELGISAPGEMEPLAAIAEPDVAVIHNVGPAHLEALGDVAGVAAEKVKLFAALRPGGTALASMDYPELWNAAQAVFPGVVALSTKGGPAPYRAKYLGAISEGRGRFFLRLRELEMDVVTPLTGGHFAENILAAAAAAHVLGATEDQISSGLATAVMPEQRFFCRRHGNYTLIDDTYNANPLSMRRAIAAAAESAQGKPLVLVLGEMREMGVHAEVEHRRLGEAAAESGAKAVFYHGAYADIVGEGLSRRGYGGIFAVVDSPDAFLETLSATDLVGGVYLFKGSRSMRMEQFLAALTQSIQKDAKA